MKSILKISLAFFLALSLAACDSSKNDDDDNNNPGGSGTMTASIDGTSWNAANATATKISVLGLSSITIAGATTTGSNMTISLVNVVANGTYTLEGLNAASMSYSPDASGTTYIATSGSVTVTNISDTNLKGTFAFEGTIFPSGGDTSVTNGTFDVGYGISPF